jgi:hypothetical protein
MPIGADGGDVLQRHAARWRGRSKGWFEEGCKTPGSVESNQFPNDISKTNATENFVR